MQHADPDQLALVALGEPLEGDDAAVTGHLGHCAQCQEEVQTLRRTVDLARETVELRTDASRPPEQVWSRIAAELDLAPAAAGSGVLDSGSRAVEGDTSWARRPGPVPVPDLPADPGRSSGDHAGSGRHADRRAAGRHSAGGRRWVRPAVALVAAAAVGVVGTLVAVRPWQDDAPASVVAGSAASLEPVAGGPAGVSGRAVVVQGESGPQLDVSAAGLPAQAGYYEVWVFDGGTDMVSVGVLGADTAAALTLPPTLDLRRFHVVDISLEQYDGEQTHSTVSVLRGTLTG